MKTAAKSFGSLAFGCLISLFIASHVTSFWMDLDIRRPVGLWLESVGLGDLAGIWGVLWLQLPDWIAAFVVGIIYGFIFRNRLFVAAGSFCVGMIGIGHVAAVYSGMHPGPTFGWDIAALSLLWDTTIIPIHVLGACLFSIRSAPASQWRFSIRQAFLVMSGCALAIAIIKYAKPMGVPLLLNSVLSSLAFTAARQARRQVVARVAAEQPVEHKPE